MSNTRKSNKKRIVPQEGTENQKDGQDNEPMGDINSEENSSYYFDSYSNIGIHEEMIKDRTRTESYYRAVMENRDEFKDKVVLDVGAGTGILSIFCARAGARKVFAVEASSIATYAEKIVWANGLQEKIQVIHGRVEEIELPEKVDIIISEWMGYFLFYESMLDTVIYARDKWLKEEGLMFPSHAQLFWTAISDQQYIDDKINWWNNIGYGNINMSVLIPFAKDCLFTEPAVESLAPECEVTNSQLIIELNCRTVTVKELCSMPRSLELQVKKIVSSMVFRVILMLFSIVLLQYKKGIPPLFYPQHQAMATRIGIRVFL